MTLRPARLLLTSLALGLTASMLGAVPTAAGSASPAAAPAVDDLFTPLGGLSLTGPKVRVEPTSYSAFRLDVAGLRTELAQAPTAEAAGVGGDAAFEVEIPDPSGELQRFAVVETAVGEPGFEARHPEIRTYAGNAIDDTSLSVRMDVTPMGFHASVRRPGGVGAWYVDPAFSRRGETRHLSYYGAAVPRSEDLFVERDPKDTEEAVAAATEQIGAADAPVTQKDYRLALVTDPTYASYFGAANVTAEKATLVNRVNQVYMDDMAIQFLLVADNDLLNLNTAALATTPGGPCGANACYTETQLADGCTGDLLNRNVFVIGQIIGADNYDIGHIGLGINGGGVAGLGVVGGSGKARGCTGLPFPEGDFFAIDYVAHEIGHQMGANHTFNGTQANCAAPNRNTDTTLVEPGSGSSVMAYAGICQQDNLQPHSDPYFSFISVQEITDTVTATPFDYDEQQVVNLAGFDGTDAFTISCAGCPNGANTVTRGALTYTPLTVANAISAATGENVTALEVSDYDSGGFPAPGSFPSDNGFTVDFTLAAAGLDIPTLVITPAAGTFTTFTGVTVNGGPETNQGFTSTTVANTNPTVTAPADMTIPIRTPFTLTGSGADDDGDSLIYLWEQTDSGSGAGTGLVDNNKVDGPLFRMFGTRADVSLEESLQSPSPDLNLATSDPSRTFPDLAQVVADNTNAETGTCPAPPAAPAEVPVPTVDCYSEFLPTAAYANNILTGGELNFRLSARDQQAVGGGYAFDDVTLTLDPAAGPFLVTSRDTAGSPVNSGDSENVTWDVAGTDGVSLAPNVTISLSTDGGKTFPTVLVASTPNDGSEDVTIPQASTTRARIKVEAVGNYFFDVNDADFTIVGPLTSTTPSNPTIQYSDTFNATSPVTVTASSVDNDGDQIAASLTGLPGVSLVSTGASADGVRPGTASFRLDGPVTSAPGTYPVDVSLSAPGGQTATSVFDVVVAQEDASVVYTGDRNPSSDPAAPRLRLAATVTDNDDGSRGDITTAIVRFVDRATGARLCVAPVTGGPLQGTASCNAVVTTSAEKPTYTIGMVVLGRYSRDNAADDVVIPPSGPAPRTTITKGPRHKSFVLTRRATFRASSTVPGSTFVCSLDGKSVACDARTRLRVKPGTHLFSVAARSPSGVLDPTPATRVFAAPFNDGQLVRQTQGWKRIKDKASYRGGFLFTKSKGQLLTRNVKAVKKVALVAHTGPGFGRVVVLFNGKPLRVIDLSSPSLAKKVLIKVASFKGKRSGRVSIRTLDDKPVRIDGLGLLTKLKG
ncbi:M12 family metallo-peptidase [Nocardioides dilutus]